MGFHLILTHLLLASAWATPPIEGGVEVTDKASKGHLAHVHRITWKVKRTPGKKTGPLPPGYETDSRCTATQVSPEWFLTAAHCITQAKPNTVAIPGFQVVSTVLHPGYSPLEEIAMKKNDTVCEACTKYDVALVKVVPKKGPSLAKYPPIVSVTTEFATRKDIKLAGFGANDLYWAGNEYKLRLKTDTKLFDGSNEWDGCDYLKKSNPVLGFIKDVSDVLYFNSNRIHYINGLAPEDVSYDRPDNFLSGKASLLPGDSGGAVFEQDSKGETVITGVSSKMQNFRLQKAIEVTDAKGNKEIIEVPAADLGHWLGDQWDVQENLNDAFEAVIVKHLKRSEKFPELRAQVERTGKLPTDYSIFRLQKRLIRNHITNLASPENQAFLKKWLP